MSDRSSDEEDLNFLEQMKGVTPHKNDKASLSRKPVDKTSLQFKRLAAIKDQERVIDGLSNEAVDIVESHDELLFAAPGIQLGKLKKLRQGHISWEAGLDLHGYTIDEARDQLSTFIRDSVRGRFSCVLVVHGKAHSQSGQQALIKSYVNDWLRQLKDVLAFCSAQPRDGGAGAIYVLLKRSNTENL